MIRRIVRSREFALVLLLAAIMVGFGATVDGFLDLFNILERGRYWVVPGLMAIPMTFIIATAGIDLSVASILALSGVVLGVAHTSLGLPIGVAAVAAIGAGTLAGAANGALAAGLAIPPLVVTLGTMALYRGLAMGISEARAYQPFPEGFAWLSQGDLFVIGDYALYLPVPVALLFLAVALGHTVLRNTWPGRASELLGANPMAARYAALPVRPLILGLYAASGCAAGVAALLNTALYNTAKADAAFGMELEVIAAVVVGGTRISGGRASVLGSLLGLLILGMLRFGLELAGLRSQYIVLVVGVLLVAAVVFNEWMARRAGGTTG